MQVGANPVPQGPFPWHNPAIGAARSHSPAVAPHRWFCLLRYLRATWPPPYLPAAVGPRFERQGKNMGLVLSLLLTKQQRPLACLHPNSFNQVHRHS